MKLDIKQKDQIVPIWKPVGVSTHTIAIQAAKAFGVPVAHTGILDPIAEGVVIILTGETRFQKYTLAGLTKEYVFNLLFGIGTDTYDLMGIIKKVDTEFTLDRAKLKTVSKSFVKSYKQVYPPFSAKVVKGKPLHYHAQMGTLDLIKIPTIDATIYELELLELGKISAGNVYKEALSKIGKTESYFRQDLVLPSWEKFKKTHDQKNIFNTASFRCVVSRGVYIRSISVEIAEALGTCGLAESLVRTKNGEYTKENSFDYQQLLALL